MKHVSYGVKPEHYAPVGVALLWTLERGLGTEWTPDLAAAWTAPAAFLADRRG
jgi:hemoglobin-like flavoprotein